MTEPAPIADCVVSFEDAEDARSAIYQAVGAASVCWDPRDCTGVFDDKRACAVAEGLIRRLVDFGLQIDGPVCDPECRDPQSQCMCEPAQYDGLEGHGQDA